MTDEPFTLKESLFNTKVITEFADAIYAIYPALNRDAFLDGIFDAHWPDRALMDRMRQVTTILHDHLPAGYRPALEVLLEARPHMPRGGFITMVPSDFVANYGLDDPDASIPALEAFTQESSAEFAVRPFIARYPNRLMAQMLVWADNQHPDVRRLASEGCRPRLPWGIRLHILVDDPSPIIPILEKLKHDESESVRRSVANNLNDISKDNPQVVLELLRRWNAEEEDDKEIRWITGHALRTLVKLGDPDALELLDYPADPQILVREVQIEPSSIAFGDKITLTFTVESAGEKQQKLMIDYIVYHMRANGKLTPKVFKHKKVTIEPGEIIEVKKNHSFRPVTTRKYYPGAHAVQPQINGKLFERVEFEMTD